MKQWPYVYLDISPMTLKRRTITAMFNKMETEAEISDAIHPKSKYGREETRPPILRIESSFQYTSKALGLHLPTFYKLL